MAEALFMGVEFLKISAFITHPWMSLADDCLSWPTENCRDIISIIQYPSVFFNDTILEHL